jgi:hypothetical protein
MAIAGFEVSAFLLTRPIPPSRVLSTTQTTYPRQLEIRSHEDVQPPSIIRAGSRSAYAFQFVLSWITTMLPTW